MNVSCPECRSVFRVDPSKLPAASVRARCAVCGGLITVAPASTVRDEFAPPTRQNADRAPAAFPAPASARAVGRADAAPLPAMPPSMAPSPKQAAAAAPAPPPAASPFGAAAAPVAAPPPAPPVVPPPRIDPAPAGRPQPAESSSANLGGATAAALFGRVDAPPPPTGAARSTASVPPRAPSPARPALPFVRPGSGPPAAAATTGFTPFGARATPPAGQNAPRRPINPFLANDPNAKARRLARALISDMITYFPEKREEGLRSGTLKVVFEEEIKKSYEEYVEQVGREFAEGTPHFQDALNEILAGGRKLF